MNNIAHLPSHGEDFEAESFMTWMTKKLKKLGSEILEKALLAYYVLIDAKTPNAAKAILVSALAYLVLPIDVIPDFIPVVGFADDLAALAAAIAAIAEHIRVRHLRRTREQMREWGIVVDLVPDTWRDDARVSDYSDLDEQGAGAA